MEEKEIRRLALQEHINSLNPNSITYKANRDKELKEVLPYNIIYLLVALTIMYYYPIIWWIIVISIIYHFYKIYRD